MDMGRARDTVLVMVQDPVIPMGTVKLQQAVKVPATHKCTTDTAMATTTDQGTRSFRHAAMETVLDRSHRRHMPAQAVQLGPLALVAAAAAETPPPSRISGGVNRRRSESGAGLLSR